MYKNRKIANIDKRAVCAWYQKVYIQSTKRATKMYLILIVTFSVCGCFNLFSTFLITKSKPKPDNQRAILINVTQSSSFFVVGYIVSCPKAMIHHTILYESFFRVKSFFACFTIFSYKLFVIYLTLDGLFAIWFNIYYSIYFTSTCVKRVVIGIWLSLLSIGIFWAIAFEILVSQL